MSSSVPQLYRSLQSAITSGDSSAAARHAASLISSGESDPQLFVAQLVALLQDSQYAKALELLKSPAYAAFIQPGGALQFHYAYALYRSKNPQECLSILSQFPEAARTQAVRHLEAQAAYRAGDFTRASKIYKTAFSESEISADVELQANILCAYVASGDSSDAQQFIQRYNIDSKPPTYELAYNAACAFIECAEFSKALQLIEKSLELCDRQLRSDGLTQDEIDNEKAVLQVQKGFLYQLLHKPAELAIDLYSAVLHSKTPISDHSVLAVANNNFITLRGKDEKLFDSLKKSERALHGIDEEKLSTKQREIIHVNRALVLLHGRQYAKCRTLIEELKKEYPTLEAVHLTQAALLAAEKKIGEAENVLKAFIAANPGVRSIHSQLALAQLAKFGGNTKAAVNILEKLDDSAPEKANSPTGVFRMRPAVVSAIVSLLEESKDTGAAGKAMDDAIQFWSAKGDKTIIAGQESANPQQMLLKLLEASAEFHIRHGNHAEAAKVYDRIMKSGGSGGKVDLNDPAKLEGIIKLVHAIARVNPELAVAQAQQLPKVEPSPLDGKTIEEKYQAEFGRKRGKAKNAMDTTEDGEAAESQSKKKKKRGTKRKRLPKNYDPNGPPPDPERWLPKWERSSYKKKHKKGKNENPLRGAQGSTAAAAPVAQQSEGKEMKSSTSKPAGGSAAAAAARKKKKGKK